MISGHKKRLGFQKKIPAKGLKYHHTDDYRPVPHVEAAEVPPHVGVGGETDDGAQEESPSSAPTTSRVNVIFMIRGYNCIVEI